MNATLTIVRILVGLLFIFSGLVKANDPLGLSYKMQEYFEIWKVMELNTISLILSIVLNAFEIIAGFALLLGWHFRFFSWLILLLILAFTFLTGYTYITGYPKNCGCFGDCLPITSKTSFLKDVVLTFLIAFLFWHRDKIKPLFSRKTGTITMSLVILFSFGFQWYTLTYLPVVDCLPFKKGNNIYEKMQMPANAIPDSTVITFVYKKDGNDIEFTADKFPDDFNTDTYQFVKRYDKLIRKGKNNEPPIKGFVLSGESNIDSTQIVLAHPYTILLFCEDFSRPVHKWKDEFEKMYALARTKNIPCYLITGRMDQASKALLGTRFADIPVFKCDFTAIRTAARSNPSVYLLQAGNVSGKWSFKEIDKGTEQLKDIPAQPISLPEKENLLIDTSGQQ